ncbi:MAG: urea ABC transporter substrate-binding protein, partial [Nitrospinales bacterium]
CPGPAGRCVCSRRSPAGREPVQAMRPRTPRYCWRTIRPGSPFSTTTWFWLSTRTETACWTSACRKTVRPVFEKYNHLLFYPVQYEGIEQSPNIVYTGAAPNQQIIPAVKWSFDHLGKSFFLIGSDYVFPVTANFIIKNLINSLGGKVVGEEYIPLGSTDVEEIVGEIVKAKPEVILNTINGDSNIAFFKELRRAGISAQKTPTLSFSIGEPELQKIGVDNMAGDYAACNYFQSIESEKNESFLAKFKKTYGENRVVGDPMEAEYFSVFLWAQAVRDAKSPAPQAVLNSIRGQSLIAPEGYVYIDPDNQHTWKHIRIGKISTQGSFDIAWSSKEPIRPVPYPIYRPISAWDSFLNSLYTSWGGGWENPGIMENL